MNLHIDLAQSGYDGYTANVYVWTSYLANPFAGGLTFTTPTTDLIRITLGTAMTAFGYSSILVQDSNHDIVLVQQLPLISNSPPPPSSIGVCGDSPVLVSDYGMCPIATPVVVICTASGVPTATCEAGTQPEIPTCEGTPAYPTSGVCSGSTPTLIVCSSYAVPRAACLPAFQPPPPPAVPPPPPSISSVSGTAILSGTSVTFTITASGNLPNFYNVGYFTSNDWMVRSGQKYLTTSDNPQTWIDSLYSTTLVSYFKYVQVVAGTDAGDYSLPYTIQL